MHLILATKAGRKTVIASSGQPAPEVRYLHAVSITYELRASKFFLQLNCLDFRINRSTCKPFLVKGNVVQPPPSPGDHVMPDYSKSTQRPGVCATSSWTRQWAAPLSCTLTPCGHHSYSGSARLRKGSKINDLEKMSKLRFLQQPSKNCECFIMLCSVALSPHTLIIQWAPIASIINPIQIMTIWTVSSITLTFVPYKQKLVAFKIT